MQNRDFDAVCGGQGAEKAEARMRGQPFVCDFEFCERTYGMVFGGAKG